MSPTTTPSLPGTAADIADAPNTSSNTFTLPEITGEEPCIIATGGHSQIELVSNFVVAKTSLTNEVHINWTTTSQQLSIEASIYERLGPHPCITKFYAYNNGKIYLERLRQSLAAAISTQLAIDERFPTEKILLWSAQLAHGLHHVHQRGVFHVDIAPRNMLLDWEDNLKLSDFGGSSIDGSSPTVMPVVTFEHPFSAANPSVETELFSVGSSLYELEALREPYHDIASDDVVSLYREGDFPDTKGLVLGEVIENCWYGRYESCDGLLWDIGKLQLQHGWAEDDFSV